MPTMQTPSLLRGLELAPGSSMSEFFGWCRAGMGALTHTGAHAAIGRIRGTGPGASFSSLISQITTDHPIVLERPFEACKAIAGGVWRGDELVSPGNPDALLMLRFDPDTRDLPAHQHAESARFIVVLEGRGFFHVSDESFSAFTGESVRTTAVRERDVIAFEKGVLHTFSTAQHGMTLLSFHAPYIPLEDEGQYAVPSICWSARERVPLDSGRVVLEPSWRQLV